MINELTRKNAHIELDHIFKIILPAHGMTERPEQIRLSHTMLDAMFENRIALSDAGTGIGKTYAYLTAAIVYSHSRLVDGLPFQPVIIATSSIALQNAIVREYLPFLSDALADDPHITTPILAALRKGKSHYVCDERLRQHLQQRPNGKNAAQKKELYSLRDVLDLDETQQLSCFDRERVCVPPFCDCKHPDYRYRRHLTECGQKRYLFQICNQNLWLADCMHRENGLKPILPDACTVIVDEVHKLPETAREMFGTTLSADELRSMILRLKQERYVLAADRLFSASSTLLQKMAELSPEYPIELLHDDLSRILSTLFSIGRKLPAVLKPATKRALEQITDKVVLFLRPKADAIRCTAEDDDGKLMLRSVPADITSRMRRTVWSKQLPLLLTSGTLAIGSSFRRFQDECGLCGNPRVTEAVAVSPFDYAANCRLFFPKGPPRFSEDERYHQTVARQILRLLQAANGHALVLFTSYKNVAAVCEYLNRFKSSIPIFVMHRNRPRILQKFKSTPGAVLLATGAAWEGMDFPGDCVSLLIIPRLPFAFPDAIHEHENSGVLCVGGDDSSEKAVLVGFNRKEGVVDAPAAARTLNASDYRGINRNQTQNAMLYIKEATKKGYKEAHEGDSIDLGFAGSNTRRGRVGKNVAHTLQTSCIQGIVARSGRVRRLMPRECFRLQGFSEDQIDKILAITSDAQAYKQAGNSVTVSVIEAIDRRIRAADAELHNTEGSEICLTMS